MTPDQLIDLEHRFGGYHTGVPWGNVSPFDRLPEEEIRKGWLTGGDRMGFHGYAPAYARALSGRNPGVIVELGILRGVGLAMWCDLFPNARVIGLDIDLSMFRENLSDLKSRGAFTSSEPEVYEFDELAPDAAERFSEIIGLDAVDLFIDDALHYDEAILRVLGYFLPRMSIDGVYIIEDNDRVHEKVSACYPSYDVQSFGELTVIRIPQNGT